jgi:rod shape-determining protein MreD
VISFALLTGHKEGLICGLLVGFLLDLSIGHPFGLQILTKGLIGYFAGNLAHSFFREQLGLPLLIFLSAILSQDIALFLLYRILSGSAVTVYRGVIAEYALFVLYSLVFAALLYRISVSLIAWLDRSAYDRRE